MTNTNDPGIYAQPGNGQFISPFILKYRPMQRLFLYNLKDDPYYKGFEPQYFSDIVNGKGLIVIAYRQDGKVDVYFEPGLNLEKGGYQIESGLNAWVETSFERSKFDITPYGVDLDVAFADIDGRRIEVRVLDISHKERRFMRLLAPISGTIKDPVKLMAVYLFDFDFVRRPVKEMRLSIDGLACQAVRFPVPIPGFPAAFVRYSGKPFMVEWNEQTDAAIESAAPLGEGAFEYSGALYDLVENNGHFEINQIRAGSGDHHMGLGFEPPFPDVIALRPGAELEGRFTLLLDGNERICAGCYAISCMEDEILLGIDIDQGWQPINPAGLLRFVMIFAKIFKQWPTTYRWRGRLQLEGDRAHLSSGWKRVSEK
jgi:hypothetical protein